MDHKLRCDSVRHCKWADEVLDDAPWVIGDEYLRKHNIDFVAHDGQQTQRAARQEATITAPVTLVWIAPHQAERSVPAVRFISLCVSIVQPFLTRTTAA